MNEFNILELKPKSHIHFIGIGGISMSGLSEILHNLGFVISGSNINSSNITNNLINKGYNVYIGHDASYLDGVDAVVYTAAVKEDNCEIIRAKELGLPIIERSTLLGEIMRKYKYSIGVSGTHGKTTTTSMVSLIFLESNLDPTITVGGELNAIGGNLKIGQSEYFIAEACEYVDSFLQFHPFAAIITNIDADHLDYFKDIEQITSSFTKYANLIPQDGYLIANIDDERVKKVCDSVNCNVVTYGINNESHFLAINIEFDVNGFAEFQVVHNNEILGQINLSVPGIHNVYNSLGAIACSMSLGVTFDNCKIGLAKFTGTKRRFEYKGSFNNVTVVDDYAHHPTEIKATLSAAKNYPHNNIWCIFQPHLYSRTKLLLNEFTEAFDNADKIIVADIYAAREKDTGEISSLDLVTNLKARGKDAIHISDFETIKSYILNNTSTNDLVLTMGAGDIFKVGEELVK